MPVAGVRHVARIHGDGARHGALSEHPRARPRSRPIDPASRHPDGRLPSRDSARFGPGGYAASHIGPRVTAVFGLWVLAFASVGVALGTQPSSCTSLAFFRERGQLRPWRERWHGWRRGTQSATAGGAIGATFGAGFVGIVLGSAIGAVAAAAGRQARSRPSARGWHSLPSGVDLVTCRGRVPVPTAPPSRGCAIRP